MRLYLFFILFFFIFSPLKANTIYNLIKIPNLEIYNVKVPNKLRYLNSTSPFRIGVQKNISCHNSEKEKLDNKYKIIRKNLDRYSKEFLKKINLKYVVLCENLSISGINTAGIPNNVMKTLILDIGFNEKYFERVIHHEVFHIINDSYKEIIDQKDWKEFNSIDFTYSDCSTCSNKIDLSLYEKTNGFLTEYSKSTASEDMAEVFSHLMYLNSEKINKITKSDMILSKKILFIKNKIKIIHNTFIF